MTEPSRAVFLSYALQDVEAARRIADSLRAGGIEVWFDQSELRGGDAWDRQIRQQIQNCALFMPIISANTQSRTEGYFRLEWKLGVDRSHLIAQDSSFFVPITIDDTRAPEARVPDKFYEVQWTSLPKGESETSFVQRVLQLLRARDTTSVSVSMAAIRTAALPGKPSIAVLPFINMSGDPEQDYFADGMVEEIITGLSRIKWLFVISRNSTSTYKGKPIDVKAVGRELGVRYVLEGSVRRSGSHVRVTGQLIETETATNVWADRYDGTLDDIFTLQDELTMHVIGAVEPTLRKIEIERARRKRPDSLDAYDLFLRALPFAATAMPEHADKALELLEQAIRLEPNYAVVHGYIAWCHEQRYLRGGLKAETREAASRHAHAAIETGADDATALAMGGFVVGIIERNYDTALEALDRSLTLSPSSALAFGFSSIIRAYWGDYPTAIEHAGMGIRLSPYDPLIYLPYVGLALAHFFAGNFVEAASAASRASAANPRFSVPCCLSTAALLRLGRNDEAKSMAKVLLELQPGFTVSGLVSGKITTLERMDLLANALREAGLPE